MTISAVLGLVGLAICIGLWLSVPDPSDAPKIHYSEDDPWIP